MDLQTALDERVTRRAVHVLPQPQSAHRLRTLVSTREHTLQQVVAAVMLDPMLAAAVLRIANSPAYARGGPTSSLTTAVQRIGEKELSRLSLASGLGASVQLAGPLLEVRRSVMQRSFTSAALCESLAREFGVDPEAAFIAGLLHDVGVLVALGTLELLLTQRFELEVRTAAEWLELAARHHVELGAVLAEKWALPTAVYETIIGHHASHGDGVPPLVQLVRLSDQLTAHFEAGRPLTVDTVALSPFEAEVRERMVKKLSHLPGLVAALASDDPLPTCASLVARQSEDVGQRGVKYPASFTRGRAGDAWVASATRLSANVQGKVLPSQVEELTLMLPGEELKVWVRVTSAATAADGATLVDLVPFAPTAELTGRLADLSIPPEALEAEAPAVEPAVEAA
ncbi:MAG: HDOD domain-containing protein [Myxococcaceae bacterium]